MIKRINIRLISAIGVVVSAILSLGRFHRYRYEEYSKQQIQFDEARTLSFALGGVVEDYVKPIVNSATNSSLSTLASETTPTSVEDYVKPIVDSTTSVDSSFTLASETPTPTSCTSSNSPHWLNSENRLGNYEDDPFMTHPLANDMVLNISHALVSPGAASLYLQQTLAYNTSRFVDDTETDSSDASSLRRWSTRLMYLSIFYHQHRHAIAEASERKAASLSCREDLDKHGVKPFDYECPNAKFILLELSNNGMGMNVRGGLGSALLAGLISDRVVVVANHKSFSPPWHWASCPRKDYQCVFMPSTPCTLSFNDIKQAKPIEKKELNNLLKHGQIPSNRTHEKIWTMKPTYPCINCAMAAQQRLYNYSLELIDAIDKDDDARLPILRAAASEILKPDEPRPKYNFALANVRVAHAATFFVTRPRLQVAHQINTDLDDTMESRRRRTKQQSDDFDAEQAFGLPIRASDKCKKESECLSFEQYMKAATLLWRQHHNDTGRIPPANGAIGPTVLFTTESRDMKAEYHAFVANYSSDSHDEQRKFPYRYSFLSNEKDVTPDSGFAKDLSKDKRNKKGTKAVSNNNNETAATAAKDDDAEFSADEAIISALTSLKFQLQARVTVGNCCSNFHVLLSDFLVEGLGMASQSSFTCLQDFDDPEFKVCCQWHKGCKPKRAKALAAQALTLHNDSNTIPDRQ